MAFDVCVALLRGINVGGRNRLTMDRLRSLLANLGATDVTTYIQSGNVAFRGSVSASEIADAVEAAASFRPHVLLLSLQDLQSILSANPFADAARRDPKSVHVYFCDGAPNDPADAVARLASGTERVGVVGTAAYLLAPDGIGRSRLAAGLEKALAVPVTARNWKTAVAIRDMALTLKETPK